MAAFLDLFADSFRDASITEAQQKRLDANISIAVSDMYADDLQAIKSQLAARKIKVGKFLGVGNVGLIFRMETTDGKPIESAVIRIDQQDLVGRSDTPAAFHPLLHIAGDFYCASVVPLAEKIPENSTIEKMKKTLAVLNTDNYLPHLSDIELDQLMYVRRPDGQLMQYLDGTPAAVMVDLNSIKNKAEGEHWLGDIDSFITVQKLDRNEIMNTRVSPEELLHLRRQMKAVEDKVGRDLRAAGIHLGNVPGQRPTGTAASIG